MVFTLRYRQQTGDGFDFAPFSVDTPRTIDGERCRVSHNPGDGRVVVGWKSLGWIQSEAKVETEKSVRTQPVLYATYRRCRFNEPQIA